ncbi:MAG: hypothetical protein PHZ04_04110 [Patescibacteria group bacterium]|nr:hypothetical protein [Patescibacteria group bacterium]MDD5554020.1 hypothetical protein [Patescibacteria group bacterium]
MTFLNGKKLISLVVISFFIFNFLLAAGAINAEEPFLSGLENTGKGVGYETGADVPAQNKIASFIGDVIGAVMVFIGVAFMVLIWMGALDIVGAGGNDETVKKGKDKIKNGAIGVLVVFAAYIFAYIVLGMASGNFGVGFNIFKI